MWKEVRMKKRSRMTIAECARLMNVREQFVRVGLQKEVLPFGYAVRISGGRWTYYISREKFEESTGIRT